MQFFSSVKGKFNQGMTLLEVVIVLSIYMLLMGAVSTSVIYLYQANGYTIAQSYEIDHARRGLQSFIRDVREMTYADDGTFPIAVMEDHRFGFYSDVDRDDSVEYTEYVLATSTITKYVYAATGTPPVYNLVTPVSQEILSEYVQNIIQSLDTFRYYDADGVEVTGAGALLTDVRYIEARIIVNIDPNRSPGEFLLHTGVAPRNLKDNL
jgi:type II secretory pathway pseudopilin PulG